MQSLISPHFMFNCLNLLSSSAIIEKAPTVYQYSVMIAKYLREALNYIGKNIPLQQEFEFTQHYTDIQKIRFGNRITFSYELEKGAAGAMVPAIIIQPLLENAVVHGVGKLSFGWQDHRDGENASQ